VVGPAFQLSGPIVVLGVGAVGGATAAGLLGAGHQPFLVDGWAENVEAIRRDGLSVTIDGTTETFPATALYFDELDRLSEPAQVVLLACKSYDTELLVRQILPRLAADGVIVSLQNGINEDRIASLAGPERTLGCVVHFNAELTGGGRTTRYSPGEWHSYTVGELDGKVTARAEALAGLLSASGSAHATDDIWGALWGKLAINAMSNGLSALADLPSPILWGSELVQRIQLQIVVEAALVARAQGREMGPMHLIASAAELPASLLIAAGTGDAGARERAHALLAAEAAMRKEAWLAAGDTPTTRMISSMLQDVRKGRRPEIDYLNGYVAREGDRYGIATPASEVVTRLVHDLAAGRIEQDEAHLGAIAAELGVA
jgi:2-dehydropantoate 2-reductase